MSGAENMMDTGGKRDEHGSALAISSTAEGFEVRLRMFLCQAMQIIFPFFFYFIYILVTYVSNTYFKAARKIRQRIMFEQCDCGGDIDCTDLSDQCC